MYILFNAKLGGENDRVNNQKNPPTDTYRLAIAHLRFTDSLFSVVVTIFVIIFFSLLFVATLLFFCFVKNYGLGSPNDFR